MHANASPAAERDMSNDFWHPSAHRTPRRKRGREPNTGSPGGAAREGMVATRRSSTRTGARARSAHSDADAPVISLPQECLVEILSYLEIQQLLQVAWTCRRFQQAAQDSALWNRTHFSVADWRQDLQRHFERDPNRNIHRDHTGIWTRCVCRVTEVRRRAAMILWSL